MDKEFELFSSEELVKMQADWDRTTTESTINLTPQVEQIKNLNAQMHFDFSQATDSLAEEARENQKARNATIQTAEHTKEIEENLKSLSGDLFQERVERKTGDDNNRRYTRRFNIFTGIVAVLALLIAAVSLVKQFM